MINNERLNNFEERLESKIKKQSIEVNKNIEAIKRQADSKGLLQSGSMINDVKDLCIKALESRVDYIFEILNDPPLKYSGKLRAMIYKRSLKYFTEDLGELYKPLEDIINFANCTSVRDGILNEVRLRNDDAIKRLHTQLNLYILDRKDDKIERRFNKLLIPSLIAAVPSIGGFIFYLITNSYSLTSRKLVTPPMQPSQSIPAASSEPPMHLTPSISASITPPVQRMDQEPYKIAGGYAFTTSKGEVIEVKIGQYIPQDKVYYGILNALGADERSKMKSRPTKTLFIKDIKKDIDCSSKPKRVVQLFYEFRTHEDSANQFVIANVSKGEEGLQGQPDADEAVQNAIKYAVIDLKRNLAIN